MAASHHLGPFPITEVLGEGGSAFVYATTDAHGREIALKVLRPELDLEPREVQRFVEEAGRMRRVSHRALVPVLDVGMLPDGRPYIAMPRLRGRTLAARLATGPLPYQRAIEMFADVADAVSTLHEAGLVHRDIKPENVLWLDAEDRLVVLDLGIARDADDMPSTTTRAGKTRGTPAYMAPERFFGRSATVGTDVYELALLLYVMLAGTLPWEAEDPRGRMTPRSLADLDVPVPRALSAVLVRALDVDFERRPASVGALLAEVRAAAAEAGPTDRIASEPRTDRMPPIVVTPPSPGGAPPYTIDPALAQAPTQVSPARAFPVAGPTLASTPPVMQTPPHVATVATTPPPARSSSGVALLVAGGFIALIAAAGGAVGIGALKGVFDQPRAVDHDAVTIPPTDAPPTSAPTPPTASEEAEPEPPPTDASAAPSASATPVDRPAPAPSASAPAPVASPAGPPSSSAGPAKPPGAMPAACSGYIALMCDPKSGSTPAECNAARSNVTRWVTQTPDHAAHVCGAALEASTNGLALRRESKKPP